jgi:hypothetical protein
MKTWFFSAESASEGTSEGSNENSNNVSSVPLVSLLLHGQYLSKQEATKLSSLFSFACLFMIVSSDFSNVRIKIGVTVLLLLDYQNVIFIFY